MPVKDQAINVFISYSRADSDLLDRLRKQFSALERSGLVDTWYDGEIEAGSEWGNETVDWLHNSEIILLLISADFIASDHCYNTEMQLALQQHEAGKARVIPVILRECTWQYTPFANLKPLPEGGIPVTNEHWKTPDRALKRVVDTVAQLASSVKKQRGEAVPAVPEHQVSQVKPQSTGTGDGTSTSKTATSTGDGGSGAKRKWMIGLGVLLAIVLAVVAIQWTGDEAGGKDGHTNTEVLERREWLNAKRLGTAKAYQAYLQKYPNGKYISDAKTAIQKLNKENPSEPEPPASAKEYALRGDVMLDLRDKVRYKTKQFGTTRWMVEDLRYDPGRNVPSGSMSYCHKEWDRNCEHTRYYNFTAANSACPKGWHLPSDREWKALADNFGGAAIGFGTEDGKKAFSYLFMDGRANFNAYPYGYYNDKVRRFENWKKEARYWSSTKSSSENAVFYNFRMADKTLYRQKHYQTFALSCRCVMD